MQGVIAGGGPHTVQAGAAMLRQGGNAVDAIVAAAFASFIAEIGVVHTGGSGIAQIFDPASQRSVVYDFFSNMPGLGLSAESLTTRLKAIDFERVTIDFGATTQDFYLGRGAVAVPGNVFGLCALVDDFGSLPLRIILQPALDLAQQGLPMAPFQAQTCRLLGPIYTHTPAARTIFTKNGDILDEGDHLYIPGMFETLSQLAEEGDALLRNGSLAQALISDHSENGGLITPRDLQSYRVYHNDPIRVLYRGHEVLLPPPCSAGGVLTGFTLKLLAEFDAGSLRHGSAEQMQLFYEVMAATTRARVHWETDLAQLPVHVAMARFLSAEFIAPYAADVRYAIRARERSPFVADKKGPNNTSHISVIDGNGMAVSLTTTAGESAGYVLPGTGFIPNNMLGEEDVNPRGWHQWQPGERLPTMMTPTIVLKDGNIRLVVGSGGSARIRSAIIQVISNLLDHQLRLIDVVNRPRLHVENGVLQCEGGCDSAEMDRVERMGYPVNRWQTTSIYFGGAHTVSRMENGFLVAAGDYRRDGSTASVRNGISK